MAERAGVAALLPRVPGAQAPAVLPPYCVACSPWSTLWTQVATPDLAIAATFTANRKAEGHSPL